MPRPATSPLQLQLSVRSLADPWKQCSHLENQDNYLIIDTTGQAHWLQDETPASMQQRDWSGGIRLAVMDGISSHRHSGQFTQALAHDLAHLPPQSNTKVLEAAIENLHTKLKANFRSQQSPEDDNPMPPGCTLTLLELAPQPDKPAILFHAGDSRLLAWDSRGLELLSIDHTPTTGLALNGHISENQWRKEVLEQRGNRLSQAIGIGSALNPAGRMETQLQGLSTAQLPSYLAHLPDRRELKLTPGRLYLLATDGLWCFQRPGEFFARMDRLFTRHQHQPLEILATALEQLHSEASAQERKRDNTTFILFRLASNAAIPRQEER